MANQRNIFLQTSCGKVILKRTRAGGYAIFTYTRDPYTHEFRRTSTCHFAGSDGYAATKSAYQKYLDLLRRTITEIEEYCHDGR